LWFLTDKSGNADMANQPSPASRALLWVIENNNDEEYLVENIDQQKRSLGALARTDWLERIFKLRQHGSSVKIELMAGLTTFVTMAYIIFVNPNVMAAAGLDHGAAFVATCLGAALGCLLMGFYANWPVGLAPGMGLNAFFTYTVVGEMGYTWQVALGAVFLSGILFMIMSLSRIREWLLNSIPMSLRFAMGAGVGLFLGLIGLKTAGIVVDSPATLVTMGSFGEPSTLLAAICFLLIAVLSHRNVFGAILLSMLVVTAIGWSMGLVEYGGVVSLPPSLAPTWLAMDIAGALNVGMISVVLAFLFVNMFDTAGTLMGVAHRANLVDENGKIENLSKSLKADSTSSVLGSFVGCPPVTSYVESASGVAAGGRTGLTAVTVGVLFLLATFFAPLAGMIPAYATAGALIYVAMLMMSGMAHIDWKDITDTIPAIITVVMMPLTFSIANGIALGFVTYATLKLLTGQRKKVSVSLYVLCVIFIAKFAFL
jgi:adenine/guanine/hypoxanthine permease